MTLRNTTVALITLLQLSGLLMGCPRDDAEVIRFGVDATLQELGLGEFIQAAFEEKTKIKTKLTYAGTTELFDLARKGEIDTAFIVSEDALAALEKENIPIRAGTYAHEEFMWIGPFKDYMGEHGKQAGSEFLRAVARMNYRYLKGKEGSVEYARHMRLFREGGDAAEPGAWFLTEWEGTELARNGIKKNAFALVKRSSLLMAAVQGDIPHRLYKYGDPDLVLRMVVVEVHPGRTRRDRKPELYDFIMSDDAKKILETFGVDRLGLPIYAPGEPPQGEGADIEAVRVQPPPTKAPTQ